MPKENKETVKLYFKIKLKRYEKIWYLITVVSNKLTQ